MNLLVLDTETSGLSLSDEPIEVGMVLVKLDKNFDNLKLISEYEGQRWPNVRLNPYAQKVHQISKFELAGKTFDHALILDLIRKADILVAHNAKFDARMLAALYPEIYKKSWRCTHLQWPWPLAENQKLSTAIKMLGIQAGRSHRAIDDARALANCLTAKNSKGELYAKIIARSRPINLGNLPDQVALDPVINTPKQVNGIPFDSVSRIDFVEANFCLTGDFEFGQRGECNEAIRSKGGVIQNTVTKNTNYLIIGSSVSQSWKYGTFGAKIEMALNLKAKGCRIKVISEQQWLQCAIKRYDKVNNDNKG
jgi:DNA polymerase III epsilon subunit-like protein